MSFYWELHKTARLILEAMSLGLDLTEEEKARLLEMHSGENNQLRLLHYPPVSAEMIEKQVVARYASFFMSISVSRQENEFSTTMTFMSPSPPRLCSVN